MALTGEGMLICRKTCDMRLNSRARWLEREGKLIDFLKETPSRCGFMAVAVADYSLQVDQILRKHLQDEAKAPQRLG